MKTLITRNREEKEKYRRPRRVQDTIPIRSVWPDGIFLVGRDRYSKTFQFQDINYAVASLEDKKSMFLDYSALLNSLDSGATVKLTIHNRRMSQSDLRKDVLIPYAEDGLDHYRKEYNQILLDKVRGASAYCQDKYITVTVSRRSLDDARSYFSRIGAELGAHFARLGSKCEPLRGLARLRMFHDILRGGEAFPTDQRNPAQQADSILDAICPSKMQIKWNHFSMDGRFGRVLLLKEYASFIKDTLVTDLTALNREILLSIDILPVPMDEAIKEVNKRTLSDVLPKIQNRAQIYISERSQ